MTAQEFVARVAQVAETMEANERVEFWRTWRETTRDTANQSTDEFWEAVWSACDECWWQAVKNAS